MGFLFRKLRFEIMKNTSSIRYLKYAIGEIILVVIGILIALQINNWNSNRKELQQKQVLLEAFKDDLKTDIKQTEKNNAFNRVYYNYRSHILKLTNFDDISNDSLTLLVRMRTSKYTMNLSAFQKLNALGITKLSTNDSLNEKLFFYYTVLQQRSEEMNNWEQNTTSQEYESWIGKGGVEIDVKHYDVPEMNDIPTFQDSMAQREQIIKNITSIEGRNILKSEVFRKTRLISFFQNRNNYASELIALIQKELQ